MTVSFNPSVSYNRNKVQKQNFGMKIQAKLLQGCREGNVKYMNRIRAITPNIYTIEENQAAIKAIIDDPKTKMTKTLQILGKRFGVLKD